RSARGRKVVACNRVGERRRRRDEEAEGRPEPTPIGDGQIVGEEPQHEDHEPRRDERHEGEQAAHSNLLSSGGRDRRDFVAAVAPASGGNRTASTVTVPAGAAAPPVTGTPWSTGIQPRSTTRPVPSAIRSGVNTWSPGSPSTDDLPYRSTSCAGS